MAIHSFNILASNADNIECAGTGLRFPAKHTTARINQLYDPVIVNDFPAHDCQ
jgi:hypothetical protein